MSNKQLFETSKFLSYVLRHEPQAIGLALNSEGWVNIDALIAASAQHGQTLDRALIDRVVSDSGKKRFGISKDGQRIRAVQGHSTASVDIDHAEAVPPEFLYHGTATRFLKSINQEGLRSGSRHHVHLSPDEQIALAAGQRYGKPCVLKIKALRMYEQGFRFFRAENGVWLTDHVLPEFLGK